MVRWLAVVAALVACPVTATSTITAPHANLGMGLRDDACEIEPGQLLDLTADLLVIGDDDELLRGALGT